MNFGPRNDSEKETFAIEGFRVDVQYAIQKLMKTNSITRAELARRMGVKPTRVSKILRADSNLTVRTLAKIFFALGNECTLMSPKTKTKTKTNIYCIHCNGLVFKERDEWGRECSATDGDMCIWSDTRTPYPPKTKSAKAGRKTGPVPPVPPVESSVKDRKRTTG